MIEVSILKDAIKTHSGRFETLQEANDWIAKQEAKPKPWNYKKERWLLEEQFENETIGDAIDSRLSIDGITEYKFSAEYTIDIQDKTAEYQAIADAEAARQADIADIKSRTGEVDTMPVNPFLKQILKRLIEEL